MEKKSTQQIIFYKYRLVSAIYRSTLTEIVKLDNHADIMVTDFKSNWQWLDAYLRLNSNNKQHQPP